MRIKLLLTLSILFICSTVWAQRGKYTTQYDEYFRKYTKRYFSVAFDWRWFKAQAIAESDLRENVESWCKAKGIMQLLHSTFNELVVKYPELQNDIHDPRWNIAAGIRYDRDLWNFWRAERPLEDRFHFMFGSYNAGCGTLLRAQEYCKKKELNENLWCSIVDVASEVKGWRYRETLKYIERIKKVFRELTLS